MGSTAVVGHNGARSVQFGIFEVDLRAGELRRNGSKVKLQEQPFQILTVLLEHPGEVVSREELQKKLWPADTFVDFDHSLNAAIRRLRDALGDSAENPRFVETVARRGYRFLAPVKGGNCSVATPTRPPAIRFRRGHIFVTAALLAGVVVGLVIADWPRHSVPINSSQIKLRRLTANPEDDPVAGAVISPDGKYLAFSDNNGFYLREIESGETHALKLPGGFAAVPAAWYPDGTHLIATWVEGPKSASSLWQISIMGGPPRKLIDDGRQPSVSRQGSQIAFVRGSNLDESLWLMQASGENPRPLLVGQKTMFGMPAWSPEGHRIAYVIGSYLPDLFEVRTSIETYNLDSGVRQTVLSAVPEAPPPPLLSVPAGPPAGHEGVTASGRHPVTIDQHLGPGLALDEAAHFGPGLVWTTDDRLLYSLSEPRPNQGDSNVWSVPLDSQGHVAGDASRLTATPDDVSNLNASRDGKRMAITKYSVNPDVYVAEINSTGTRLSTPKQLTLDERRDFPFSWTPDSKAVLFASDRDGIYHIFKQQIDEMVPELMVGGDEQTVAPRLAPDNSSVLYVIWPRLGEASVRGRVMRVPLSGGPSQTVLEQDGLGNVQCARFPSTLCLFDVRGTSKLLFFRFDPSTGKSEELPQARIEDTPAYAYNWSLSPDGKILATARGNGGLVTKDPSITFLSLENGSKHAVTAHAWAGIGSIDFAADGRSLWASAYTNTGTWALLNIDLQGRSRTMLEDTTMAVGWAIPAPDGKHLALWKARGTSNVWMLERF
jgi:DNA-binding winged helix-turn-helix (wHTH) protein/Tol biopolymer transport system component